MKSASILTDQDTQMVGNDRWPATICNAGWIMQYFNPQDQFWIYIYIYTDFLYFK